MSTAYEIVTESIIKQLESGVAPWRKPWRTETPANLVSKKEYRGINIFLLALAGLRGPVLGYLSSDPSAGRNCKERSNTDPG